MMRRILLLEDDPAFLNTLQDALNSLNYEVKAQTSSKDLLKDICNFQPDLLLLDFTLGEVNGVTLCEQVKRNPEFSCVAVIIMSGYKDAAELAKQAGADDFIKKPFGISELDDKIENCINKQRRNIFRNFT